MMISNELDTRTCGRSLIFRGDRRHMYILQYLFAHKRALKSFVLMLPLLLTLPVPYWLVHGHVREHQRPNLHK